MKMSLGFSSFYSANSFVDFSILLVRISGKLKGFAPCGQFNKAG